MKFSEIVNEFWPEFAIMVKVGDVCSYMGIKCAGLDEMKKEQVKWLDNHKLLHYCISPYNHRIELKYRASKKYANIVFGEG